MCSSVAVHISQVRLQNISSRDVKGLFKFANIKVVKAKTVTMVKCHI